MTGTFELFLSFSQNCHCWYQRSGPARNQKYRPRGRPATRGGSTLLRRGGPSLGQNKGFCLHEDHDPDRGANDATGFGQRQSPTSTQELDWAHAWPFREASQENPPPLQESRSTPASEEPSSLPRQASRPPVPPDGATGPPPGGPSNPEPGCCVTSLKTTLFFFPQPGGLTPRRLSW